MDLSIHVLPIQVIPIHQLPIHAQKLISEYAKPVTRPDWRNGSYCNNTFKFCAANKYLHNIFLKYYNCSNGFTQQKYESIEFLESIMDSINTYGESIFTIYPYTTLVVYHNYYFMLRQFKILKNADTFLIRQLYYDSYEVEVEFWN